MASIFDTAFNTEEKMPPAELHVWVNSIRSKNRTGILRLNAPKKGTEYFFLCREGWYCISEKENGNAFSQWLQDVDMDGSVHAAFEPLSPLGLSHFWILLHSIKYQTTILDSEKKAQLNGTDPYIVFMKMGGAEGSILYGGVSNLPHSLFVSEDVLSDEDGIPDQFLGWKNDPSCEVSVFPFDPLLDFWRTLALRRAFKTLYDRLLERCEKQTGRSIIASFSRIMVFFSTEQALNVSVEGCQWQDMEFYPSTQDAAYYYRLALEELLEHFSAVLGPRLLSLNLAEAFSLLSATSREVIQQNSIIPEGYLS